jgi:hypothetical protein
MEVGEALTLVFPMRPHPLTYFSPRSDETEQGQVAYVWGQVMVSSSGR